jgi:putative endopeptidase
LKHSVLVSAVLCAGLALAGDAGAAPNIGFDAGAVDRGVDPCVDFYAYACGGWMARNPLPADRARYSRFEELQERNDGVIRSILQQAAPSAPGRSPLERRIGDFYGACMDEARTDELGLAPVSADLAAVERVKSLRDLPALLAARADKGIPGFFSFGSEQDASDSAKVIGSFGQGGLGLPSRDYYLDDTENAKGIRAKYVAHVQKMLELAGAAPAPAARDAATILSLETMLARGSLTREERRDPKRLYNVKTMAELGALAPSFDFAAYLSAVGAPPLATVNVRMPGYFRHMQEVVATRPLSDVKAYLRWHVLRASAPLLSRPFVQQAFEFRSRTLAGVKELAPRWRRCSDLATSAIGEAVGIAYVEKTFGEEGKARMLAMVHDLEEALRRDITGLSWMTPPTREKALAKLAVIENKIGSPAHPRDYASVEISPRDLVGNVQRVNAYENRRDLAKIGQPVDKSEWEIPPSEVNAYFSPRNNNINFPAGILQPPFFDKAMDDAVNYGAIGMIIGHELTHGFDDEGRQYDAQGNLKDWWTPADSTAFDERAACVVEQYGRYAPVPDLHVNGRLTLGENVADNGGLRIAYEALMRRISGTPAATRVVDGFTPPQRFFLGMAQGWCANSTEEVLRLITKTDEHTVNEFRVTGPVSNMPEFREAFSCREGQPMAPANACRVW